MRKITLIVIHCSASADGKVKSREDLVAEHKARGFRTIGYHYIIEPTGDSFIGRPEAEVGAHVEGHNSESIGICMIGTAKFTEKAWQALENRVRDLKARYPFARICGHRDLSPDLNHDGKITSNEWVKLCPSFDVTEWLLGSFTPKKENIL